MNHKSKTSMNLRGFTQIIWIVKDRYAILMRAPCECIRCQRTILANFQYHYPPCMRKAANRCPHHLLASDVSNKLWSLWLWGIPLQSVLSFWLKFILSLLPSPLFFCIIMIIIHCRLHFPSAVCTKHQSSNTTQYITVHHHKIIYLFEYISI